MEEKSLFILRVSDGVHRIVSERGRKAERKRVSVSERDINMLHGVLRDFIDTGNSRID